MDDKHMTLQADMLEPIMVNKDMLFLLCSDGLTDMVPDTQIEDVLASFWKHGDLNTAANQLVKIALSDSKERQGGVDNITVMLIRIKKGLPALNVRKHTYQ
jgi:serine/threonine protein phosphatase PrpC